MRWTGWLSYKGQFFSCQAWAHTSVAMRNGFFGCRDESDMEERGWVRLWGVGQSPEFSSERRLSAEQRNWMSMNGFCLEDYD